MVQRTQDTKITLMVLGRLSLFFLVTFIGFFTVIPFGILLTEFLRYTEAPCTFFFCFSGLTTGVLALALSLTFWIAVFFGLMGKVGDYVVVGSILSLAVYLFSISNSTPLVFAGLAAIALVGNGLGYVLKRIRIKYWSNKKLRF